MNRISRSIGVLALIASVSAVGTRRAQADGSVSAAQLESFVGVSDDDFLGLGNGNVYNGSALTTSFTAMAGQTVSFQYDFLTNENPNGGFNLINDFAFANWNSGTLTDFSDVASDTFTTGVSGYAYQSGYQTFSFMVGSTGTFTLDVGVVNTVDGLNDSALLLDNFTVNSASTTNGNFGTGDFTGFLTIGNAQVVTSGFGVTPPGGDTYQGLLSTASVPEPSSVVLLALGLTSAAGLAERRRRQRVCKRLA
jgi:hypothetical protein